jgi:UDP-N-acetylglucosamine 2-epimerase (non-hydrolysing)
VYATFPTPSIRKPVLVLRLSTERPEALESGFARVVGTCKAKASEDMDEVSKKRGKLRDKLPYGNGDAAEKNSEDNSERSFRLTT